MNRSDCLDTAKQYVTADRNQTCGDPEDNFATIASFWSTYLRARKVQGDITPTDVAAMMVLMKMSRIAVSPDKPDHWIDSAGYSSCGCGIATKEPKLIKHEYQGNLFEACLFCSQPIHNPIHFQP